MSSLGQLKVRILTAGSKIWRLYLRLRGIRVGGHFTCIGRPAVNLNGSSHIHIGNGVTLCNSGMANPLAEYGRCRLATVAAGARLSIGNNVGMSATVICCATRIEIGEGTQIGGGAMIIDTDFHPRHPDGTIGTDPSAVSKPIYIGENCFIGSRAIILKGVTIGDGATVGAGAVITKNIPPGATAVGNVAKIIRADKKY